MPTEMVDEEKSMKIKGTKRVVAAVICGLVMSAAPVFAQDNQATPSTTQDQSAPSQGGEHHGPRGGDEHRIEHMTKALNLTPDQVTQVKAIDMSTHDQMRALHGDTSMQPADKRAKMMAIHQESTTKVRAVLNDEQKSKFDAMEARMKERREEHGEQGPPPPPPAQ